MSLGTLSNSLPQRQDINSRWRISILSLAVFSGGYWCRRLLFNIENEDLSAEEKHLKLPLTESGKIYKVLSDCVKRVSTSFELVLQNSVPLKRQIFHCIAQALRLPSTLPPGDMLGKTAEEKGSCVRYLNREARDLQTPKRQLYWDSFPHRATSPRRIHPILLSLQRRCWQRECITAGDGLSAITA